MFNRELDLKVRLFAVVRGKSVELELVIDLVREIERLEMELVKEKAAGLELKHKMHGLKVKLTNAKKLHQS